MTGLPPPTPGQQPGWFPAPSTPPASTGSPVAPPVAPPATAGAPFGGVPSPDAPFGGSTPPTPLTGGRSRKRLPAAIAALVVVALGLATALWLTSDDAADPTTDATTVVTAPLVTAAPATTEPALTLPTTPPSTEAVPTTEAPAPTTLPPTPAPGVPAGSIVVTDAAGWAMSMDPSWTESAQNGVRNWFTNTGSDSFDDNINVTVETLTSSISLDEYLAAAIIGIQAAAPDFQLVDQRRILGPDGVELVVIGWSATLPDLPPLSFLQTLTITPTSAYVATFTSEPVRMSQLAALFEPYLLTLRGA